MHDHPAESQRTLRMGVVVDVHPATWEVDVRLIDETAALIPRCKVQGTYLPEKHDTGPDGQPQKGRQSKVYVGWVDGSSQAPMAFPIHNVMIPADQKANYVLWSEHLNVRTTINRQNELEVRVTDDGKLYRFRIQKNGGVVRTDTPSTRIVQTESDKSIEAHCDGDLTATCANATVTADSSVKVKAASAEVEAGTIKLKGATQVEGNLTVIGNINATGSIVDVAGNTPHHSHG